MIQRYGREFRSKSELRRFEVQQVERLDAIAADALYARLLLLLDRRDAGTITPEEILECDRVATKLEVWEDLHFPVNSMSKARMRAFRKDQEHILADEDALGE